MDSRSSSHNVAVLKERLSCHSNVLWPRSRKTMSFPEGSPSAFAAGTCKGPNVLEAVQAAKSLWASP